MKNYKNHSDDDLLLLLREGNSLALEEIFNRYWVQLYSAAYKRVKIHEVAEEIVQDLFTGLWVKKESLSINSSLAAYLHTAVKYQVLNYIQKEVVRRNYRESAMLVNAESYNNTEELIYVNDLNARLDQEILNLPTKCRSIFTLSRKMYKSNKEIAVLLGISEKTVENHLTKAIRRLKLGLHYFMSFVFVILNL